MAKSRSKRSHRSQREEKQQKTVEPSRVEQEQPSAPVEFQRGDVDFAQEYFYVYTELRNVLIVTSILFLGMVGLLYVL
jgi:hypothetical protein